MLDLHLFIFGLLLVLYQKIWNFLILYVLLRKTSTDVICFPNASKLFRPYIPQLVLAHFSASCRNAAFWVVFASRFANACNF